MASASDAEQSRAWRASRLAARRFRESGGNPLFLWRAVAIALGAGIPAPRAALDYLQRVADRLGTEVGTPIQRPAAHVLRALELAGRGPSAFERRRRFERDRDLRKAAADIQRAAGGAIADALEHLGRDPDSLARQARRRTKVADSCP